MKNILFSLTAILLLSVSFNLNAQELNSKFDLGSNRLGVGVGMANHSGSIVVPPIHLSYERGVFCAGSLIIGIGGEAEYGSSKLTATSDSNSGMAVQLFGKCHLNFGNNFEFNPYVGIGYGSYGDNDFRMNCLARSIGTELIYRFSSNAAVFIGLQACSVPEISGLRVGLYF